MTDDDRSDSDVARLRFGGGRYEEAGFPLDGIDELEKYQRLVIAAAKKLWWEQNPERKRLPAHFEDRVRLRLTQVDKGSVLPVIERGSQLDFEEAPDLLGRAIDYVDETFASIVQHIELPDDITDDMFKVVKLFGVSLRDKESATFRWGTDAPIKYGVEQRKALLDAIADEQHLITGTLIGKIRMLDAAQEFILVDADDRVIKGSFARAALFDDLHEALNLRDSADLLWLVCLYLADEEGRASRIDDVTDAGLFAKSDNPWAAPLAKVATLPDGWLDGEGKRVELTPLSAALDLLGAITEAGLDGPSIFPDPDGGIRLEWLTDDSHTVIAIDDAPTFSGYHLNVATGEEEWADGIVGIDRALEFARGYIGGQGAARG